MARISGVNLPLNKQVHIALTYIYGIGDYNAQKICKQLNIEKSKRVNNLTEDEILKIREVYLEDLEVSCIPNASSRKRIDKKFWLRRILQF